MLITELEQKYIEFVQNGKNKGQKFDFNLHVKLVPYVEIEKKMTLINGMVDNLIETDESGWAHCDESVRLVVEFLFVLDLYTDVTFEENETTTAYDIASKIGLVNWLFNTPIHDIKLFLDIFHKTLVMKIESINSTGAVLNRHLGALGNTIVEATERFVSLDVSPETIDQVREGLLSINETMEKVKELNTKV